MKTAKYFKAFFLLKYTGSYFPAHAGRAPLRRGDNDDSGSFYDKGMVCNRPSTTKVKSSTTKV